MILVNEQFVRLEKESGNMIVRCSEMEAVKFGSITASSPFMSRYSQLMIALEGSDVRIFLRGF
jgi:hypothetical protein